MGNNKKQSTIDALNRYSQKQLDEGKPKKKRKNKKPEKEVEAACLKWMRDNGWSVQVLEAKSTWSPSQGRWCQQGMKAGTPDCVGSTDDGVGAFVEFKAPGRLSSFNSDKRYLQRKFIVDKINTNAFACVVDSAKRLETIYLKWLEIRTQDKNAARNYLLAMLPQKSEKTSLDDKCLFDD